MMKKIILALLTTALVAGTVSPAFAISASYRAKLEHSGCTQVSEADGSCNVNKSKAQNQKHTVAHKSKTPMITHDGKRLPTCASTGGSQADNGTTCWF
ncbi:hypothetical protein RHD99_12420 [Buttiauxella selenatireducens]|uniref:Secreted protein n=1 Tax=Buttiauxella selenatireducens TaxID=3073902 RepID=A0ABY9S472_9ENTR|nr:MULTISPECIES: hypothetical protein [unclassified Buttiauxella]WMY72301.1 hypothetical protein RHD99_12420 [Buttiauxella sp. R73]GDX06307.1 hypothetical protein BSPA111_25160 [Buttiauxella sp. A111]